MEYPQDFEALKTAAEEWPFLKYSLIQIETNLLNSDTNIMRAFADLVSDSATKNELMELILTDFETCRKQIEKLMDASVEERRISRLENNKLRGEALAILHQIQLQSLKKWRRQRESAPEESDQLLLMLLLIVNVLSGGFKKYRLNGETDLNSAPLDCRDQHYQHRINKIPMEDCIFCKIVKGEANSWKVWENEDVYAFLDIYPVSRYHTLIIPKKHYVNIFDIPERELKDVIAVVRKISKMYESKLGIKNLQIMSSNGREGQQDVFHSHFHIVPRQKGNGLTPF